MHILKTVICSGLFLASASIWAQETNSTSSAETTQKIVQPYGNNPNIFHVWAYKAQEGVIGAAKNVGEITERGVAKVKPSVDQAWDNTKNLASTTVNKVDAGATQAAQTANAKIQDSKETFGGKPQHPAPIEHQSLSEPSNNNSHNSSTSSNSPLSTPSQNQSATTSSSSTTSYAVTDL